MCVLSIFVYEFCVCVWFFGNSKPASQKKCVISANWTFLCLFMAFDWWDRCVCSRCAYRKSPILIPCFSFFSCHRRSEWGRQPWEKKQWMWHNSACSRSLHHNFSFFFFFFWNEMKCGQKMTNITKLFSLFARMRSSSNLRTYSCVRASAVMYLTPMVMEWTAAEQRLNNNNLSTRRVTHQISFYFVNDQDFDRLSEMWGTCRNCSWKDQWEDIGWGSQSTSHIWPFLFPSVWWPSFRVSCIRWMKKNEDLIGKRLALTRASNGRHGRLILLNQLFSSFFHPQNAMKWGKHNENTKKKKFVAVLEKQKAKCLHLFWPYGSRTSYAYIIHEFIGAHIQTHTHVRLTAQHIQLVQ